jgi:hypothetical protein
VKLGYFSALVRIADGDPRNRIRLESRRDTTT